MHHRVERFTLVKPYLGPQRPVETFCEVSNRDFVGQRLVGADVDARGLVALCFKDLPPPAKRPLGGGVAVYENYRSSRR